MTKTRPRAPYQPPITVSRSDFLRGGSDAAFREAIYALVQGVGRLLTCREAFGRALDLTASQFAVLFGVAYQQGRDGVTVKDLSEHIALAPTHVTTEVGRLVGLGLLIKRPSVTDRRSVLVSLSRHGEKAVAEVAPFVRNINDLLFKDISAEDLETTKRVARAVFRNSDHALVELRRRSREAKTS
ncbi:MAG: MarR family transcriptional regulator [Xanthobacteraceae bacterium]|jgi:MarR family transcriptional regulator, organic hydroperoxide resistance regulator